MYNFTPRKSIARHLILLGISDLQRLLHDPVPITEDRQHFTEFHPFAVLGFISQFLCSDPLRAE